jgi:exopolyphosphatase / guanosine-5'-triphosphate,3'-diphosphate pyrophosphatase
MTGGTGTLVAAIDIGASAIRMDVAEVKGDGTVRIVDSLRKGVQLGRDAFPDSHISEESIRATCDALRDFKKVMDGYGVVRSRTVATSAVRESVNSDTFVDRVLMNTGLEVEVIDGAEENRLTFSAVRESLRSGPDLVTGKTLVAEVGGGSTDVTLMVAGEPVQSGTFPLGSIRLRAGVQGRTASNDQQVRYMKRQISNLVSNIRRAISLRDADAFVAVGGDVRVAARVLGAPNASGPLTVIPREQFAEFADSTARVEPDKLVKAHALSYGDAETLAPSLLTYNQLLKETRSQQVYVSNANIRLGILLELAPSGSGEKLQELTQQILSAARSLGQKYQYDEGHAERVRELAEMLFDHLKEEHHLTATHRLYLQVASLLHDVGLFVNSRSHHKHSYYLIASSDLFGLRRTELEVVANIARYHRRALPQRAHPAYMALDRDDRMLVSKLGALLRVANALDKEYVQKAADLNVVREGDDIVLLARNVPDLGPQRSDQIGRSDFFTEVFGRRLVIREVNDLS